MDCGFEKNLIVLLLLFYAHTHTIECNAKVLVWIRFFTFLDHDIRTIMDAIVCISISYALCACEFEPKMIKILYLIFLSLHNTISEIAFLVRRMSFFYILILITIAEMHNQFFIAMTVCSFSITDADITLPWKACLEHSKYLKMRVQ